MTAREDYGFSLAVYQDKKNKGLLVKNLNSNNIPPDGLLNTKIFESNVLHKLLDDTSHHGFASFSFHRESLVMIQDINSLINKSNL